MSINLSNADVINPMKYNLEKKIENENKRASNRSNCCVIDVGYYFVASIEGADNSVTVAPKQNVQCREREASVQRLLLHPFCASLVGIVPILFFVVSENNREKKPTLYSNPNS
jgi:hypothetical protein